jgi:peptidoglycan/LPS O-acetylase OafA/YrhL
MAATPRDQPNNFDAIRIVAALAVLFSHHFALTGQEEPAFFGLHTWGGMAVIVFFIVSGYLVTGSWLNDPNVLRFGARRVLRLWPALTVVVVLTAYGLGAWVTSLPLGEYWGHRATLNYLLTLVMRIHYVLPGVFEHNPYASGVNGSLWTIPLEVRCYVVLAAAGLLGLLRRRSIWLGCVAAYMVWFIAKGSADLTGQVRYGRELSAFFLAGSALFMLRAHWQRQPLVWLSALGAAAALLWWTGWHYTATLVLTPLLVLMAGTRSTPILRRFGRWGDPSYGAYLLAFPVQQTVIHFLYPKFGFGATLALAAGITLALAYASWHAIEKPALRLKPSRHPRRSLREICCRWTRKWRSSQTHMPRCRAAGPANVGTALPLILLSAAVLIAGQLYYLIQSDFTAVQIALGMLPVFGGTITLATLHAALGRLRPTWARRTLQALMIGTVGFILMLTLVAVGGIWQTGSIPRLQQLDGLTWDMVAPSVWALLDRHGLSLLVTLAVLILGLAVLWKFVRPMRRPSWRLLPVGLTGIALLGVGAIAKPVTGSSHPWLIATQVFRHDVDTTTSLSDAARRAETTFFQHYRQQLAEVLPEPRYPAVYSQLRDTNVIWLVLESVRAKDVPLYGGTAEMPHFMRARQHMILLEHLYVQDPRSTKAFTQMDLGRFGLLSWSTYSNNIPWMFPQDGLASHLSRLGYATYSLVNTDAFYDNNQTFQQLHGYQKTWYRQALNPGTDKADDLRLLAKAHQAAASSPRPFYMMLWPVQTHHPYGHDHWIREGGKRGQGLDETPHQGQADHPALPASPEWNRRLVWPLDRDAQDGGPARKHHHHRHW